MGNMSYCMFENTYYDLVDCYETMEEDKELSESESKYRKKLVALCGDIASDYCDTDDMG